MKPVIKAMHVITAINVRRTRIISFSVKPKIMDITPIVANMYATGASENGLYCIGKKPPVHSIHGTCME